MRSTLDELVLALLSERPGQSAARLAKHPEIAEHLETLARGERVSAFYRVRGALRRLREEGLAYCAKGLHDWYPVGVIPSVSLDPQTRAALAEVRAHRRARQKRRSQSSPEATHERRSQAAKASWKIRASRGKKRPSALRGRDTLDESALKGHDCAEERGLCPD